MPRYTVVYEGSPIDVKILSGEPAPGRAVTVGLGDLYAEAEILTRERDRAMLQANEADARVVAIATEKADMLTALRSAQVALAMLTAPDAIKGASVLHAWAHAVEAEAKVRAALAKADPCPA